MVKVKGADAESAEFTTATARAARARHRFAGTVA